MTPRMFPVVAAALLLAACNRSAPPAPEPKKVQVDFDPTVIEPSPSLLKDLKLGAPTASAVGASIDVSARIEVDETRVTRVGSPVLGRISSLLVHEGQQVTKGQVLALLNSTGLSDAQLGFLKTLSTKQQKQYAVERAQQLLKADVIGTAELQRRDAELLEASAELDAARDQLGLLGMTSESVEVLRRTRTINSVARVIAPMDGTVLDRKITLGQMIQPTDTLFEVADLSNVWLVADVHEQNTSLLVQGLSVEAEITALPGRRLSGKLSFVSSTLNPETRTVRARMDLPNPNGRFKPAMLAVMHLKEQATRRNLIPLSAVVREGNTENVFVERTPGSFQLRPVKLGEEFDGRRVLLDGVSPNGRIVLDGAFHLNNERRRLAVRGSKGS